MHGCQIKVAREEVDVNVGLLKGVGLLQRDSSVVRKGLQQINNNSYAVVVSGRRGIVLLEIIVEHWDKVNLKVRLPPWTKGVDVAVGLLVLDVLGHLLEVVVDAMKSGRPRRQHPSPGRRRCLSIPYPSLILKT